MRSNIFSIVFSIHRGLYEDASSFNFPGIGVRTNICRFQPMGKVRWVRHVLYISVNIPG